MVQTPPLDITPTIIQRGDRTLQAQRFGPSQMLGRGEVSAPGILFVHGWGSDQAGYRERASIASQKLGAVCLTFDLAAHGQSPGLLSSLTLADHLNDVIAAYDELAQQKSVDARRIGLCGASYGAYLSVLATTFRPVSRLMLRAPALYSDAERDLPLDLPRRSDPEAPASTFIAALTGCSMPTLVLESQLDDVIPHGVIEVYLDNLPKAQHAIIKGAKHSLATDNERAEFVSWIVRFFSRL